MMFKKTLRATWPSKPQCLGRKLLYALSPWRLSLRVAMRYALCAMLFFVLFGCQASLTGLKPPLEDEGEVYLYIQPFPQEAERLRFTLEEVFAVSGDGKEIPFTVSLAELKADDLRGQRLLAHGRLPPGLYIGLSFKVKKATLKVEEGKASLLLPERPVRIDFPFTVSRKRAQVISLTFRHEESIIGGVSFSPSFSVLTPAKPISSLAGYVTNKASHNITVFDKKLRQVVGVIATGAGPAGMALDQGFKKVYVALSGEDAIEVIDIAAQEITNRIRLDTGDRPQELALTPDGRSLLVVNNGSSAVSFVDPVSLYELTRINVGNGPNSILIDSRGRRAFVFNTLSSTITVLDIPLKAVVATLSTDPGPLRGEFSRRGDRLYVIHEFSSFLTVIDPASLSVIRRFSVRMGMNAIKVDPITDLVYLGRKNDVVVEVYDPLAFVPVDAIRTGGTVPYLAIDGEENNLYLVNPELRRLTVSNLVSKRTVYEIDVGEEPYWVTVMGER